MSGPFLVPALKKAAAPVGPIVLVRDFFEDTDGKRLDAHIPNIDLVGGGWSQNRNELQINNNEAWADTGFQLNLGTIETNEADVIVKGKVKVTESINYLRGISCRSTAANAYLVMAFFGNNLIFRSNNTTYYSQSYPYVFDQYYDFRLECNGSNIKGFVDDAQEFDETVTQYQTVTTHGVILQRRDARIDEIEITTLT